MPWKSSDPVRRRGAARDPPGRRRAARPQQNVGLRVLKRLRMRSGCRAGSRTAARRRRRAPPARAAPRVSNPRCSARSARCRRAAVRRRSDQRDARRRTQRALATRSPRAAGVLRAQAPARAQHHLAGLHVFADRADVLARRHRLAHFERPSRSLATPPSPPRRRPRAVGAPVMMRTAWPAATRPSNARPAARCQSLRTAIGRSPKRRSCLPPRSA